MPLHVPTERPVVTNEQRRIAQDAVARAKAQQTLAARGSTQKIPGPQPVTPPPVRGQDLDMNNLDQYLEVGGTPKKKKAPKPQTGTTNVPSGDTTGGNQAGFGQSLADMVSGAPDMARQYLGLTPEAGAFGMFGGRALPNAQWAGNLTPEQMQAAGLTGLGMVGMGGLGAGFLGSRLASPNQQVVVQR
jgi:hypothetical protein